MDKRITSSSIKEDHLSREALELLDELDNGAITKSGV
jgi:hypothetical protein